MKLYLLELTLLVTMLPRGATYCRDEYTEYEYYKSDCALTQVPTDIPASIDEVYLDRNAISNIAVGAFSDLGSCTKLGLQVNKLTRLGLGMFDGLGSMVEFRLHNNFISDIESGSFGDLERCTRLWLYDNKLTQIRVGIVEGLSSLERLYLSHNRISQIEAGSFSRMRLRELRINDNQLTSPIAQRDLINSQGLILTLNNNPLECDSNMCWMKQANRDGHIVWTTKHFSGKPDCRNYRRIPWDDVTLNCDASDLTPILPSATVHLPFPTVPCVPAFPDEPASVGTIVGVIVGILIIIIIVCGLVLLKYKGWRMTTVITTNPSYRVGRPEGPEHITGLPMAPHIRSSTSGSSYHSYESVYRQQSVYPQHYITPLQGIPSTSGSGYEIPVSNHNQSLRF